MDDGAGVGVGVGEIDAMQYSWVSCVWSAAMTDRDVVVLLCSGYDRGRRRRPLNTVL